MFLFLLTALLSLPLLSPVMALEPGKNKLDKLDPDVKALVEKIDQTNKSTETLQANFVQKKELSLLAEPMSLSGKFFLKKNVGMKFDFAAPDNMEIFFTQRRFISLSHNERTCSYKKIPKRKTDLTQLLLSEKLDKLLDYFSLTNISSEENEEIALLLTPKKRKMKKRFKEIRIYFNSEYLVSKVSVIEKDGDYFEVILTNIQVNQPLDDSVFVPNVPEDYQSGTGLDPILGSQIGL